MTKKPTKETRPEGAIPNNMMHLDDFIREMCVFEDKAKMFNCEAYPKYLEWCKTNNLGPVSKTAFGVFLSSYKGLQKWKERPYGRYYWGIRLK